MQNWVLTELDSGERAQVAYAVQLEDPSALGLRDRDSGRLLKGRLARGDYLTYRALGDYRVEQLALTNDQIAQASLVVPR